MVSLHRLLRQGLLDYADESEPQETWSEICPRCDEDIPLDDELHHEFCDRCYREVRNEESGRQPFLDFDGSIAERAAKHAAYLAYRRAVDAIGRLARGQRPRKKK